MNVNDKKILEALVRKYGNDGVNNAISKLNESKRPLWCGIPEVYHIYNGDWATPEVEYNGCRCSEWDIQDSMTEYMKELIADGEDWGDPSNYKDFCRFCQSHVEQVQQDIIDFSECNESLSESLNENKENVIVLFNDLPEYDDQYREYYEEDIEEGNVDPNEMDYETYVGELNARFIEDLEDAIDRFDSNNNAPGYVTLDNKHGKYATEVYYNLWDAIKELASGEYFMLKQVGGHLELEVTNYNAQHRSRYSIYMLNSDGIEAFEEGEGDDLNDPKYWQPMKPIM